MLCNPVHLTKQPQKDAATRQSKEDGSYEKDGFGIYRVV